MKKNFTLFKSLFLVLFLTIFGLLLNAQTTVTYTFSEHYANRSKLLVADFDSNIRFTPDKGSSSTLPTYYTTGGNAARFYQGGAEFTLTAKNGATITNVVMSAGDMAGGLSYSIDGAEDVALNAVDKVYTLSAINSIGNIRFKTTGTSNKTRVYLVSIAVTYTVGTVSPTISALPQAVSLSAEVGATAPTQEITVSGTNLTADITSSLSGTDAGQFALSSQTLPQAGGTITVSYTPSATAATHTATLTLSSEGAADVVITLNGKTTEPLTITGEGTETNPYTVADVKLLKNSTGTTKYWVEGYIVGTPSKGNAGDLISADLEAPFTSTSAIVLAPTTTTTDLTEMIPVQLPSGSHRIALNLKDNATNYQKKVRVYGTLELYYSASGVKNVSKHYIYPTTHIDNTTLQTLRVWTRDGNILLQAQAGEQIEVYNTTGQRIATTTSQEGINTITVSGKGLFIVRMGNSISKVVL